MEVQARSFNPDYFLLLKTGHVVVVETKADNDNSVTNVGKLKYATDHFKTMNDLLAKTKGEKRRYFFHFVSPRDYGRFFEALRNGKIDSFMSSLQSGAQDVGSRGRSDA